MNNETLVGPFGARQLGDGDWQRQGGTMYWIHLDKTKEPYSNWSKLHFQLAAKFCLNRCSEWFYHSDDEFVFGSFDDFVLFKLWVSNNHMIHQQVEGSIE